MMKRSILAILTLLVMLLSAAAVADEQISFEENTVSIFENEKYLLVPVLSDGLQGGTVTYKSGDNRIVAVNADGELTGVSKGNTTVTASLKTAKKTYKATVKVSVKRPVTGIELNEDALNILSAEDGISFILAQSLLGDALPEADYEAGMALNKIILVGKGRQLNIKPTVLPSSATDRNYTAVSSNEAVLSAKKQGLTGETAGASILTVSSTSNPEIRAVYGVLVVNPVTRLSVDTLRATIGVGGTSQLDVSFEPDDATFKAVQWVSENPKIATVDENGLVTGVSKGRATIRANALDGSGRKDSVAINVQQLPTSVKIEGDRQISLAAGKSASLKATVSPANASSRTVTWSSSDPAVARVSQDGRVTAVSIGFCDIIATSSADPDLTDMIQVSVIQEVTGLKFTNNKMEMSVGSTAYPQIEVSPANASNPVVEYTVANTKIATVDDTGMIHALAKGSTSIRAKATDGSGKTATMNLTVVQLPESISLSKTEVTINTGRTQTIKATVSPKNANNTHVNWESTDPSIAKVSKDGQITAVKAGYCQIICRARGDDSVTAAVDVTVHQLVTKITPEEKTISIDVTESGQIRWTVGPEDVTDPTVTLSSNKTSIATVDQDGTVHTHMGGECTITIKANDDSKKQATVRVIVVQPVEGVYMETANAMADVDGTVKLVAQVIPSNATNKNMIWHSQDETIATVSGKSTKPTVTGHRWGTVEIIGYTQDGGFSASAWVTVQNYDTAVRPVNLYLENDEIKLALTNVSNLNLSRVEFTVECFDIYNQPLICNVNGSNYFDGIYQYPLSEGETTRHGRFNFIDYLQPYSTFGRIVLTVTSYRVQEGWRYDIPEDKQKPLEITTPEYIGYVPTPEPVIPPNFTEDYIVQDDDTLIDTPPVG